jgi:SAM-dependent methyltransferase
MPGPQSPIFWTSSDAGVGAVHPSQSTATPRGYSMLNSPDRRSAAVRVSARKAAIRAISGEWAARRNVFIERNRSFHTEDEKYLRFLIPEGMEVLEVGCATGRLLAALKPSRGVGVDLSPEMIEVARADYPQLTFTVGDIEDSSVQASLAGPFDFIVLSDTIGFLEDCQSTLRGLRTLCDGDTRLIIAYRNYLWAPILKFGEMVGLRMPQPVDNWLRPADIANILALVDFEIVREDWRQLIPLRLFGIGTLINRFIGTMPGIRRLCLRNYLVGRPLNLRPRRPESLTVVVPCRNERGNIEPILRRIPQVAPDLEIIFVEGGSSDGTYQEVERLIPLFPGRDVKLLRQDGKGKGNAVFRGFAAARGEVLMILDADISVAPEDLPKFYEAIVTDKAEFVNGSRLVYPVEKDAMQLLNRIANHIFSLLFSWLTNQRFTDTLCGTKALRRRHYDLICANRHYFGDFDPFGDFDLIFGAAKLNLKIVEIPVPYGARSYGTTNISRFSHGWLLLRMVVFAFFKLKALW